MVAGSGEGVAEAATKATCPNSKALRLEANVTEVQSVPGVAKKVTGAETDALGVSPASNPLPGM